MMISAFQSREFGLGMKLTDKELEKVNEFRKGKKYVDEDSAQKRLGSPLKKDLTSRNPFVVEFEYGASKEGYWNYELMVLQLEDCVDVVKVLYPQIEFLFLFDHSCGHDKQREDGLNVNSMSESYGGKQRKMRNTKILTHEGYLGEYDRILNPGDTQSMVFCDDDNGPFWMSPEDRLSRKYDCTVPGTTEKKYTKQELLSLLKSNAGYEVPPGTHIDIVKKVH